MRRRFRSGTRLKDEGSCFIAMELYVHGCGKEEMAGAFGLDQPLQATANYLWGILNAIRLKVTNSMLEAKNTRIQHIKKIACGFRNRERFNTAILFHLGKLDFSPSPTR